MLTNVLKALVNNVFKNKFYEEKKLMFFYFS